MRRVGREEAERLIRRVRPDAVVAQVRVGDEVLPDEPFDVPAPPALVVSEFEFEDGAVYAWSWGRAQSLRPGSQLWCSLSGGVAVCVRARTVMPEPEVMTSHRGSLRLLRSRTAADRAPLVDPGVVAPADLTLGTGLTEEEAFVVLRAHEASLSGLFGPGRRGREFAELLGLGPLAPVEVVEWRAFGIAVVDRHGDRWSWPVQLEYGMRLQPGQTVWCTPLREGRKAALAGVRPDGTPVVVEASEPAVVARARSEVQDVVRGHLPPPAPPSPRRREGVQDT